MQSAAYPKPFGCFPGHHTQQRFDSNVASRPRDVTPDISCVPKKKTMNEPVDEEIDDANQMTKKICSA
jgi:hypothetical protein